MEEVFYWFFCIPTLIALSLFIWKEITMGMYNGKERLDGKLVIITGGNTGIGLETARALAEAGASLVLGCRSKERGEAAVNDIINTTGNANVEMIELDLLSLDSVRSFAKKIISKKEVLHILINNAGMVDGTGLFSMGAGKYKESGDGLEIVTQTNHLSHFLLTNLLKDKLAESGRSRVINVSSSAAWQGKINLDNINYENDKSQEVVKMNYFNSKLMNVMFTKELSQRWRHLGITSFACHPGLVRTEIFRNFTSSLFNLWMILMGKNMKQGAQTTIFLACEKGIESESGSFYADCRNYNCYLYTGMTDPKLCTGLWERSAELVHYLDK